MATANFNPTIIRVDDLDSQEQQVTLNGVTFFLKFIYSSAYTRDNWTLTVLDAEENNLLSGKRITSNTNLTATNIELTKQINGYLFCVNTGGIRTPINRDNFGTDLNYQIWYVSQEEVDNASSTIT